MDGSLNWLAFEAPYLPAEVLFEQAEPKSDAFFWDDGSTITVGVGVAARASGRGPNRWSQVRRQAQTIFRRLENNQPRDPADTFAPRLFGGLTFDDQRADFVLPRWVYRIEADGLARLGLVAPRATAATAHSRRSAQRRAVEEIEKLAEAAPVLGGRPVGVLPPDADSWRADVEAALQEIRAGRLRKVVAARPFEIRFGAPPSVAAVLRALEGSGPEGPRDDVRFAFHRSLAERRETFLGRTPERLVAVAGRQVRSEALAGTAPAGPRDAARLLDSTKDGHEHRLVVDEIVSRLRPLCTRLLHDMSPKLRASSGVQHLLTPIEGELKRPRHLLDVARRLHPTPAVCGLPTREAARWIADNETTDRGWYAGPVGHFDAAGNGELRVALRCATLQGESAQAWAGAGLVAGSDPDRELEEIRLKARTMLRAFESSPSSRCVHPARLGSA